MSHSREQPVTGQGNVWPVVRYTVTMSCHSQDSGLGARRAVLSLGSVFNWMTLGKSILLAIYLDGFIWKTWTWYTWPDIRMEKSPENHTWCLVTMLSLTYLELVVWPLWTLVSSSVREWFRLIQVWMFMSFITQMPNFWPPPNMVILGDGASRG